MPKEADELTQQLLNIQIPILDIANSIALVPLVGLLDSEKSQQLMQNVLEHIKNQDVKVMVIDILGIATIDSAVAAHIIKISKATKLLGCNTIISGISPEIAQIIVNVGIDLKDMKTTSSLKNGLIEAFEILNMELVKKS